MGLRQTVEALEERWGMRAFVHAARVGGGGEVGVRDDAPVVAASVCKVPVLVEACMQVATGEVDPTRRIALGADDVRAPGPTGLSVFLDPVALSFRDLCMSMITVSDNRATDVVMAAVGLERIAARMRALGLVDTVVEVDCAALLGSLADDLGVPRGADLAIGVGDEEALRGAAVLDPARTNRTTPRESTALLDRIWTERDLHPVACAEARRILGLQVWPHRLRAGFPDDGVRVSGKTGTLPMVRNEVGVVEHVATGEAWAVAVFLRLPTAASVVPWADRAIGEIAAAAVAELRDA
ncbi:MULTISPECIES: serine hydrolase [unclassified Agrococcus]|uniref:serine hydrolase n=1 Tax=unclassified Agrococcus TaxID=2615065 RepID=UPI00361AB63D